MNRKLLAICLSLVFVLALATPVLAESAPPCNDTDGDGFPSGREYARYHVVPMAQAGELGAGGHVPGEHMGFSFCKDSGE